jgi:Family of unknown function (DUF6535)
VTVLDLKPNPQEKSAFYLENIYQLLANDSANVSRLSIPITPANSPPFSPPNYVIWVNKLWFSSLVISLTSAMLATMLQQWARRYLRITQRSRYTPHDGARIRAFFARGVKVWRFSLVAEVIPTLIHISLFLFFSGLLVYLYNINHTVFCTVVWWVAASAATYLVVTISPMLRVDSPYYSQLSSLVFRVVGGILYLGGFFSDHLCELATKYCVGFSKGVEKMAGEEVTDPERSTKVDSFILKWTFDVHSLAPDRQLDRLFNDICGFYKSQKIIPEPRRILARLDSMKFSPAFVGFMKRNFSLTSLSDPGKREQFDRYLEVADATDGAALLDLFSQTEYQDLLQTVDVGHSLSQNLDRRGGEMGLPAQVIVSDILANVQQRDSRWIELAVVQLGKSGDDIRRYLAHGNNNVLLSSWIHMARRISNSSPGFNRRAAKYILPKLSEFDIRATLPELQQEFCVLWNEIVAKAVKNGDESLPHFILFFIRDCYIALHESPNFNQWHVSKYPVCHNPSRHAQTH